MNNEKKNYSLIIEDMLWSFSRVNGFKNCHYGWLKTYIYEEDRKTGYYGEYGKFIHEILEKYFKGELQVFELVNYYKENYEKKVTSRPPPKPTNLGEKYYQEGLDFLENFEFDIDKYEILGVEKEINFTINQFKFQGFIDLLLRDKENNEIIVMDYKSSDPYKGASKPDKKKIYEYGLQQYLYAYGINKEYGQYPGKMKLWFFRLNEIYDIIFNEEDMNDAINWAKNEIETIMKEEDWKSCGNYWFCQYLCSMNSVCEYKL